MNPDPIRKRPHSQLNPFPFHLTDGRGISVPHEDFITAGQDPLVVLDENDVDQVVDGLHIVSVEDRAVQN